MQAASVRTVTKCEAVSEPQELETTYKMVTGPGAIPETMPVEETVANALLELDHPPDVAVPVSVMVVRGQRLSGPVNTPAITCFKLPVVIRFPGDERTREKRKIIF